MVKKVSRLYSDFDLNFSPHPVTGDLAMKYDVQSVKQSLKTLLLTEYYERPFQPKLGSPVHALLFENLDPITANALQIQIELLIQNYEPRVSIENISVTPQYDQNGFKVDIFFYVTGAPDPVNFSTILTKRR